MKDRQWRNILLPKDSPARELIRHLECMAEKHPEAILHACDVDDAGNVILVFEETKITGEEP